MMRRILFALTFACVLAFALSAGGGGASAVNRQRNGIVRTIDFTALSTGACTLPTGLAFTRASSATVQTGTSTIVTAGIGTDAPRCGRRLDANSIGLVIEESRTNAVINGSALSTGGAENTRLNGFGAPTITSGWTDPASGTLAIRVQAPSGTNGFSENNGTIGSVTNVGSMWLRAQTGTGLAGSDIFRSVSPRVGDATLLSTAWLRVSIAATGSAESVAIVPVDGRDWSAVGGATAGARDVQVAFVQREIGSWPSEYITTTTASATRTGEHLEYTASHAVAPNGRLAVRLAVRPKATLANYSAAVRLWTRGTDYAEISTGGALTVSIGGSTNTTAAASFSWAQYDTVEIFIAAGGGFASVVSYRVNGGATTHPTVTGSALGSVSTAGALDLLCSGTGSQFSSWVTAIEFWKGATKPSWA
jgi:hypothetical protein